MYDPDDILRSVRRYVSALVEFPWALDLERKGVADSDRPAAFVEAGSVTTRRARISVPQGEVTYVMPVTVTLYPSLAAPREAGRTARHLAHALGQLIIVGAEGVTFEDGRPAAGPERIPLYDYADVPLIGTAAERTPPEFPHDVLWAEDHSVHAVQDSQDPQRWTIILEMRVSWEAPGRVGPEAPVVTQMPQTAHVPPV